MTTQNIDTVVDRLAELIQSGQLPSRAGPSAARMMERLTSPVRLAVLGFDASARSDIRRLIDTGSGLGMDALKISVQDVDHDGTEDDMRAAVLPMVERADMVLWVGTAFDAPAQRVWSNLPDAAKNHAFLVLNDPAAIPDKTARTALRAHGFAAVFAFDIAAALRDIDTPDDGWNVLDGDAEADMLFNALAAHVNEGCRADMDGALMFIQRFSAGRSSGRQTRPMTRAVTRSITRSVAPTASWQRPGSHTRQVTRSFGHTAAPEGAAVSRPATSQQAIRTAGDILVTLRTEMTQIAQDPDTLFSKLGSVFADLNEMASGQMHLANRIQQAQDMLVLLELERTPRATEDACIIALQLKRELEAA